MSKARANFAESLNSATSGEVIIIKRRGQPDAALVGAELLEDYLASVNPRIIRKVKKSRQSGKTVTFDEAFRGL